MPRIVSLIASATEIVCALGFEQELVAISHECDFPESIRRLPACTEPKFPVNGSSAEIDRQVKLTLQDSLSVYRVDEGLLRTLRPDVIVTQSQCEVCAVSERDVLAALGDWPGKPPQIVALKPDCLDDVWNDIRRVADALGAADRGKRLVADLQARMKAIATKAGACEPKPTVACIEWIDPLMASGNWMPELVAMAGGRNLFGAAGKHAPWLDYEQLRMADPDIILVLPCGFDLPRTEKEMYALEQRPGWPELRAVREGRVFVTDGNAFFNRPGPRLVESLEILAEVLHLQQFNFGHENRAWRRHQAPLPA